MSIHHGKQVGFRTYTHDSAVEHLSKSNIEFINAAQEIAQLPAEKYNVLRIDQSISKVALLHYPEFFDNPFPSLLESWLIDIAEGTSSYRTYEKSLNPPILHRKELLLTTNHPRNKEFNDLTESAEAIGLYDETTRIGYHRQWIHLVREKGYEIIGHQLIPIGNQIDDNGSENDVDAFSEIARHRTALVRYGFSAPIQSLARNGFLEGNISVFDYGCGRGDDLKGLCENNIDAHGWDPHYAPDNPIHDADIVNLGFVINVIEDFDERIEALTRAFTLAKHFLVVSAMIANDFNVRGKRFNDGVVTQRGTFQKCYTQGELKTFIESVLDEEAITVGPGVFYIFQDKDTEQRFLANRYKTRRSFLRDISGAYIRERPPSRKALQDEKYNLHQESLDKLWSSWVSLGRKPDPTEIADLTFLIEGFGTLNKACRFIASRNNLKEIERSRQTRINDLEVFFALNLFERRKPYKNLETGLRRDIKAFFGSHKTAQNLAKELLFSISNTEAIEEACQYAAEHGLGWLIEGESLQLHVSLVEQLPSILRVYAGCSSALYGDYQYADLIKIHINSGKLTLMSFEDFEGQPLPRMVERVKLKLIEQDLEYYSYNSEEYKPPYLYHKSRYINEEFKNYPEQLAFDQKLEDLKIFDLTGYGPRTDELKSMLKLHRWVINEFNFERDKSIPDIDSACGQYLTYRDLIECGETQEKTRIPNLPKEADSYSALHDLAKNILDPVINYFGMIKLTYGFSSPELSKHIHNRIAPKIDQHASHEKRKTGRYICNRLGAAADFFVEDEDMRDVAEWIINNTPFDRLYYYGKLKPVHVSFGPNNKKQFVEMRPSKNGRLIPYTTSVRTFDS